MPELTPTTNTVRKNTAILGSDTVCRSAATMSSLSLPAACPPFLPFLFLATAFGTAAAGAGWKLAMSKAAGIAKNSCM